ncbi:hypothetical protein [Cellvibrio mixtus]|uniref:hypothetical protein n=1 Tax=Cellvibrio mixtus TaxID=39650 RepID=UPI0005873960|nr:hypothetical protein [Cellvibrio mixtus]
MAKLGWNDFISKHTTRLAFAAACSANLPKGILLDRNGKKLPTPYGLFSEWCKAYLSGEWAILKVNGGFLLCVVTAADEEIIKKEFGVAGLAKRTPAGKNTLPLGYRDSQYAGLAGDLGYVL